MNIIDLLGDENKRLTDKNKQLTDNNKKLVNENKQLTGKNKKFENENNQLKNSRSYRLGRALTWFPRKLCGGIRCLKEHGIVYTLKRIKEKISKKFSK